jgi:glycosyltransferase involved in cell wall biosynthesis
MISAKAANPPENLSPNTKKLKILCLSSMDYGGGGDLATLYNDFFIKLGYESTLIVKDKKKANSAIVYKRTLVNKLNAFLFRFHYSAIKTIERYCFHSFYETINTVSVKKLLKLCPYSPEIICLFWVSDFINAKTIKKIKNKTGAKIFWFAADNAPFTGGCHYAWDCEGYKKSCTNCPAIIDIRHKNFAENNLKFKIDHLPADTQLITGALNYRRGILSTLFRRKKAIKFYGYVDETRFVPEDKKLMKRYWGIGDNDRKVILFGASKVSDPRKGFSLLLDALRKIHSEKYILLVAGAFDTEVKTNIDIKKLGHLSESELIRAYQAADIFVCPSIEDAGPMMINQAIMCGTPVVSFDMGVATDIVKTGITGYNAKLGDIEDLKNGLETLINLDESGYRKISKHCREFALEHYSFGACKKNLINIFQG